MNKPKGTYDVIDNGHIWLYLEQVFYSLCENYNYQYIRTPIFESSELFHRGIGEGTDIISKETYDFIDKGKRSLTLRPELTAGIVRSFIENKLYTNTNPPHKYFTFGPAFRYERPQHGRNREFYQAGVEVFGTKSALLDSEIISLGFNYLKFIGFNNVTVKINNIGNNEIRTNYKNKLLTYLKAHEQDLCEDCQNRIQTNPLRALDCKIDSEKDIIINAPSILDELDQDNNQYFNQLQINLELLNIPYVVDHRLVRGLDYYTDTVFEYIVNTDKIGNQNVVGGGGRYDNLVSTLGGPDTPGVGFSFGVDRIIEILKLLSITPEQPRMIDLYLIAINEQVNSYLLTIADALRMSGFKVEIDFSNKNLSKTLKSLKDKPVQYLAIIGEDEIHNGTLTLKNNQTTEEYNIPGDELIKFLDENCIKKDY